MIAADQGIEDDDDHLFVQYSLNPLTHHVSTNIMDVMVKSKI